jgi:sec-independent protein translocase protein TatA
MNRMVVANLIGALEGPDLLIILTLVLLLFGGSKLPQLARSLGQAKRELHEGFAEGSKPAGENAAPSFSSGSVLPADGDTVVISREELEQLRAAAKQPPTPGIN